MKSTIITILAATLIGAVISSHIPEEAQPQIIVQAYEDLIEPARFKKSIYSKPSYGHAPVYAGPAKSYTYPSPAPYVPCAKNLLFSCAPSVAPVPCSKPSYSAPSYGGHAGAYSEHIPQYATPIYHTVY